MAGRSRRSGAVATAAALLVNPYMPMWWRPLPDTASRPSSTASCRLLSLRFTPCPRHRPIQSTAEFVSTSLGTPPPPQGRAGPPCASYGAGPDQCGYRASAGPGLRGATVVWFRPGGLSHVGSVSSCQVWRVGDRRSIRRSQRAQLVSGVAHGAVPPALPGCQGSLLVLERAPRNNSAKVTFVLRADTPVAEAGAIGDLNDGRHGFHALPRARTASEPSPWNCGSG